MTAPDRILHAAADLLDQQAQEEAATRASSHGDEPAQPAPASCRVTVVIEIGGER